MTMKPLKGNTVISIDSKACSSEKPKSDRLGCGKMQEIT